MSLASRTAEFLRLHGLLQRDGHLLVAVSGGVDSTVLAYLMAEIADKWGLTLSFAYIHHGLRPQADEEAEFVSTLSEACSAQAHTRLIDVRGVHGREGGSLQDVARRLRYASLERLRVEIGAEAILTAHHADDQAETVLAHLLRGSGVRGLAGIPPVRGHIVRPLLSVPRAEIEAYAQERGLSWKHDSSNDSDRYARNALRHNVIPALREHAGASWPAVLGDSARLFRSLDDFLSHHVESRAAECMETDGQGVSLAVQALKGYFEFEQLALLRHALERVRGSSGLFDEVFSMLHLIDAAPGKRAILRGGCVAFREKEAIAIMAPAADLNVVAVAPDRELHYASGVFSITRCEEADVRFSTDPSEEFIDFDSCGQPLRLRAWTDDDIFAPLGFGRSKRVAEFLSDQGLTQERRTRIPVLEGPHGIVWICGVRLDAHACVRDDSERIGRLRFSTHEEQV